MAYNTKYQFAFVSVQGTQFRIDILQDGYSGPVLKRALGGTPVLRRDRSENICGTSLEFPAECLVDNEYEEFKTPVPFLYKVNLQGIMPSTGRPVAIWSGFVTPELMSAPDIAPRYDVTISCTDGLGELKYAQYTGTPGYPSLRNHLDQILTNTGLDLAIRHVNDLVHGDLDAGDLLDGTFINLDHLKGKTCYDVLQYILVSLHAEITQSSNEWLIFKETGMTISTGDSPAITSAFRDGYEAPIPILPYGSMSDHPSGWWPVGHMSHSNIPARRRIVLTSDNHYAPDIMVGVPWVAVGSGVDSGDYWTFAAAGDGAKKSLSFDAALSQKLLLTIKVRNVGSGSDAGKMSVIIKAGGTGYWGTGTMYLTNAHGRRRIPESDFSWDSAVNACSIEVQAPDASDGDSDYVEVGIVIPAFRNTPRDYFYIHSLEITVSNEDGLYEQRVYGMTLMKYEQFAGFWKTVDINNSARGEAPDVQLGFVNVSGSNNFDGLQELMYAVPMDTDYAKVATWSSSIFSDLDYLSLMARDYALSVGLARTQERGRLNVPLGYMSIPVIFRDDHDNSLYIIDTFSWSLYDDELEVVMKSLPGSSLTVSDEFVEEGQSTNGTGHQQAQASSSGGGGGGGGGGGSSVAWGTVSNNKVPLTVDGSAKTVLLDGWTELPSAAAADNGKVLKVVNGVWTKGDAGTVKRVAMTVPTGFSVSGSPITEEGTLEVTLDNQTKNKVLASPSNASGVPSFRALVAADLPDVSGKYVTLDTTQNNISGEKTFTTNPVHIGATSGLDVSEASYIDIGPVRLQYDPTNKALHVTVKSGRSDTIGFYADGFVAAGGAAASGDQIKFVSLTGAQSVDGVKTFLANLVANGTITINGVTLSGSSSQLSVGKNASFSGISDRVNGSNVTHAVSIQDIIDRIVALESR